MKACVKMYNNEPAVMINDKAYPPMMMTCTTENTEYLKKIGDAGARIFIIEAATQNRNENAIENTVCCIENILGAVPDAYILLRISVSPTVDWIDAHPEELVTYNDGTHKPTICTSVSFKPVKGMFSMASQAWHTDEDKVLSEYIELLSKQTVFDKIAGFFLCSGGTDEWYYPNTPTVDYENNRFADFSEPFRKYYSGFLKKKYKSEEALRNAWQDENASFENPKIPDINDSVHIWKAHEHITDALEKWERAGYTIGMTLDANANRQPANNGTFLNAKGYRYVADFYDAWNSATANSVIHFAKTLKTLLPDRLVGAFYGALGCNEVYECGTATGTLEVLDSGYVDFLSSPAVYNNREPGGVAAQREMQDSFRIREKMFICEEDTRTYLSNDISSKLMGLYGREQSIRIIKRDFARNLLEDINGWWFDMAPENGDHWYNDESIISVFKRQYEIAEFAYSLDRKKKNEIAVITNLDAIHFWANEKNRTVLDHYRTSDLHRMGAPFDTYYHKDILDTRMPDYKLYIMLNCFVLTDAERNAIHEKARRNHAVILWLYAPGYIDTQGKCVQDVSNIEKTTGIKVKEINETMLPHFSLNSDMLSHPALRFADDRRMYGYIDRCVHSNVWPKQSELSVPYLNPAFVIDDKTAEILGYFVDNGEAAYAIKDTDGYISLYCTAETVRSELLMSAAYLARCHLYIETDDVIFANENFVCVHASSNGKKKIRFKEKCSPFEVYEKKTYAKDVEEITVEMKTGDTLMFSLKGNC